MNADKQQFVQQRVNEQLAVTLFQAFLDAATANASAEWEARRANEAAAKLSARDEISGADPGSERAKLGKGQKADR